MAKKFAVIFGWIFIVLGLIGFLSNPIIGSAPGAIFAADTARNVVNLLSGIVFLWVAYGAADKSATTLKVFGIIYLIIAIIGFFSSTGSIFGLMAANTAENWLDLILALFFLWGGMSGKSAMVAQSM